MVVLGGGAVSYERGTPVHIAVVVVLIKVSRTRESLLYPITEFIKEDSPFCLTRTLNPQTPVHTADYKGMF